MDACRRGVVDAARLVQDTCFSVDVDRLGEAGVAGRIPQVVLSFMEDCTEDT